MFYFSKDAKEWDLCRSEESNGKKKKKEVVDFWWFTDATMEVFGRVFVQSSAKCRSVRFCWQEGGVVVVVV